MDHATGFVVFIAAVQAAALLVAVAAILRRDPAPAVIRFVAAWAACLLIVVLGLLFPLLGYDFRIFWEAGRDLRAGCDPYAPEGPPFINPPTALPLFALFALLPERVGFGVSTVLNIAACAALPVLARRALRVVGGAGRPWDLPDATVACLAIALVVSEASLGGLYLGQLGILAALALLAALDAQGRDRPILAGACLAVATVKIGTMIPFLLMFLRKPDARAWASLVIACALLIGITGRAADLPGQARALLDRVERLSSPGRVNDYTFEGTRPMNILGFDHAFYRLGMRHRPSIRVAQAFALLATGLLVAHQVLFARLPRDAAASLVALYATLFLYHRVYDAVILALPLAYLTGRARATTGGARRAAVAGALAILSVLYLKPDLMARLTEATFRWGARGRLVQALALPYATWLILLTMVLVVWGESHGRTDPDARRARID